jgi:hypothetical protein
VKRLVHDLRKLGQIFYQEIVLGGGTGDAERVGFLKRVAADQLAGDLTGQGHDGDRIHQGVDQAGDQVGRARTGGGAADADFSGGSGVALRGERGVLFVADEDVLDRRIVQGVIKRKRDAAGVSENDLHFLALQAFEDDFRAAGQTGHFP